MKVSEELEDADFRSLPEPTLVSARDERRLRAPNLRGAYILRKYMSY